MFSKIILPAFLTIFRLWNEIALNSTRGLDYTSANSSALREIIQNHPNGFLRGPAFFEGDYYPSLNPTSWNAAEADCQRIFKETGREGGLVSIETEAELKFLRQFMEKFGSGKKYWTSGIYSKKWLWGSTGEAIGGFAQPPPLSGGRTPSIQDRLVMNVVNRFTASFDSNPDSRAERYICEVSRDDTEEDPGCEQFSSSMSLCQSSPIGCAFCPLESFTGPRCDKKENLIRNGCAENDHCLKTGSTGHPSVKVLVNGGRDGSSPETQIFCPNTTRDLEITFRFFSQPLDVYILMDYSASMLDDKENMIRLSNDLMHKIQDMSPDYRVGFGTFVDKPTPPKYVTDYSFRNVLPLTSDTSRFKTAVASEEIRHGVDIPESQLDALFQAAACTSQIGWRTNSRHILLLITDDPYHKAGDGAKQAVGLPSFNGQCSLDSSGRYDKETVFDYPSENQVVDIITKKQIVPIFAITKAAQPFFKELQERIKPSAMGTLGSDSSNVVEILADEYRKIERRIELETVGGMVHPSLNVRYYSDCNSGVVKETKVCEDIGSSNKVTFTIRISMGDCNTWGENHSGVIKIRPNGLPTAIEIPVKLYCKYK